MSNTLAPSVTSQNGANATMSDPIDAGVKPVPQHVKIVPVLGKQKPAPESPPKNDGSAISDSTPELPRGISSDIVTADQNCNNAGPMRTPLTPPPPMSGQIISFLPQAQAMELIPQSEQSANGKIDPDYIQNVRAVIHPDYAPERAYVVTLIPAGMNTYVGQRVQFISGHASPELACHYIPNLIMETTN